MKLATVRPWPSSPPRAARARARRERARPAPASAPDIDSPERRAAREPRRRPGYQRTAASAPAARVAIRTISSAARARSRPTASASPASASARASDDVLGGRRSSRGRRGGRSPRCDAANRAATISPGSNGLRERRQLDAAEGSPPARAGRRRTSVARARLPPDEPPRVADLDRSRRPRARRPGSWSPASSAPSASERETTMRASSMPLSPTTRMTATSAPVASAAASPSARSAAPDRSPRPRDGLRPRAPRAPGRKCRPSPRKVPLIGERRPAAPRPPLTRPDSPRESRGPRLSHGPARSPPRSGRRGARARSGRRPTGVPAASSKAPRPSGTVGKRPSAPIFAFGSSSSAWSRSASI